MESNRAKRRFSLYGRAHIKYRTPGPEHAWSRNVQCLIANISEGGMGIYAPILISGDVDTTLTFRGPNKRLDARIGGGVIWNKEIGTWYAVGIQFDKTDFQRSGLTSTFFEQIAGAV